MNFVLVTKNKVFFEVFRSIFCSENDTLSFYGETAFLTADLIEKRLSADYVFIDGHYFSALKNFIYEVFSKFGLKIPAVVFEDSFNGKSQTAYWLSEIEAALNNPDCLKFLPVLEKLEKVLKVKACLKARNITKTGGETVKLAAPHKEYKIPGSVNNRLYEFFLENRERVISVSEIEDVITLQNERTSLSANSVYTYISRLKKSISPAGDYELVRICKGGYRLVEKEKLSEIIKNPFLRFNE